MVKMRIIETNEGIQNEMTVETFDLFARRMRDKGFNGVDSMIASGIQGGDVLEVGPGPGYVGLELAKKIQPTSLTGCEISPAMIHFAKKMLPLTIFRPDMCWGIASRCPLMMKALIQSFPLVPSMNGKIPFGF